MGKKKNKQDAPEMMEIQTTHQNTSISHQPVYGPQKHRTCRDIPCCFLFLFFWGGIFAITVLAVQFGDLNRLRYGTDYFNNTCGTLNAAVGNVPAFDATGLTYVHYLGLGTSTKPIPLCVSTCPTLNTTVCVYGTVPSTNPMTLSQQWMNGSCAPTLFEMDKILNRCIPKDLIQTALVTAGTNSTLAKMSDFISNDLNGSEIALKVSHSLYTSWQILLGMSFFALLFSFIWLFLLNYLGGFMIWLTLCFANASCAAMTGFLWYNWYMIKTNGNVIFTGNTKVDSSVYNETTLLTLAIIFSVVFVVIFLISLISRKRIKLAIVINNEASKSLRSMPLIFLFPIMKYIILVLIFAYFTYVFALLATSGTVISESTVDTLTKTANNAPFTKIFTPNRVLPFFQIYIVLGFFWTWNFIMGVWQTTIAGAVASWFWTKDKHQLASSPVQRSFGRCFRYHLGSIALGSFIIAIVQTLRVLLLYIQKNMKKMPNHQTVNYILACIQCCFALIERIIALINTNAYIEIAVYGYGFCEGAKKAFDLLVRNAYRLIVVEGVGGFLLFLGKLLIVSVTCIVGMVLLFHFQPELGNFNAVPLIFIFVLAWFIASLFVAVMDMAIDTIFLCFCEDSERNDGSLQKPYFMSKELKEFTDKHKCDAPKF